MEHVKKKHVRNSIIFFVPSLALRDPASLKGHSILVLLLTNCQLSCKMLLQLFLFVPFTVAALCCCHKNQNDQFFKCALNIIITQ